MNAHVSLGGLSRLGVSHVNRTIKRLIMAAPKITQRWPTHCEKYPSVILPMQASAIVIIYLHGTRPSNSSPCWYKGK